MGERKLKRFAFPNDKRVWTMQTGRAFTGGVEVEIDKVNATRTERQVWISVSDLKVPLTPEEEKTLIDWHDKGDMLAEFYPEVEEPVEEKITRKERKGGN